MLIRVLERIRLSNLIRPQGYVDSAAFVLTIAAFTHIMKLMASLPHIPDPSVEEALGVAEVARILGVHPRTIERRRGVRKAPRPLEAQREEKLHRIWRELTGLFTIENAIYWLKHPVPVLENRRPVEVMAEDGGLDRVLEVVGRMSWGIPA
jgi:putative toxin-antitoxin system antitoxin component (TIGR02293 family)